MGIGEDGKKGTVGCRGRHTKQKTEREVGKDGGSAHAPLDDRTEVFPREFLVVFHAKIAMGCCVCTDFMSCRC